MRTVFTPCLVFREDDDHTDCGKCKGKRFLTSQVAGRPAPIAWKPPREHAGSPGSFGPSGRYQPQGRGLSVDAGNPTQTEPTHWNVGSEHSITRNDYERMAQRKAPGHHPFRLRRLQFGGPCGGCGQRIRAGQKAYWRPLEVRHRGCLPVGDPNRKPAPKPIRQRKARRIDQARESLAQMHSDQPERTLHGGTLRLVRRGDEGNGVIRRSPSSSRST